MYFNFDLTLNMTLSSADTPFRQFGPRSGPKFCPDLIGVQTAKYFRGYEKVTELSETQNYAYWDANFLPGTHGFHQTGVRRTHVFLVGTCQKSSS